jgi:hypothetical protein
MDKIVAKRGDGARLSCRLAVAIVLLTAGAAPAAAAAISPAALADAFSNQTGFAPMDRADLGEQRGGYDGIAFGIFLSGTLSQPATSALPAGITVSTLANNQIQIVGGVGNLAGASGIFQFTNVVGDMNVINNNIIINVTVQPGAPTNTVVPMA